MKTMANIFWETVELLQQDSGPFDPINNRFSSLNNAFHPLRNTYHPLNNPYDSLNNPLNANLGKERAQMLQKLLAEYVT